MICVGGASLTSRLSPSRPSAQIAQDSWELISLAITTGVVSVVVVFVVLVGACLCLPLCAWCCLYGGGAFYFIV